MELFFLGHFGVLKLLANCRKTNIFYPPYPQKTADLQQEQLTDYCKTH